MRRSAALALALVATAQSLRLAMPPRPAVARASHIVMAGKKQGKKASKKANAKAAEALAAAVGQPAPVSSVGLGGAKTAAGGPPPKASRITATPEGLRDVVLAEAARDERDVGLLDRKVGELEALRFLHEGGCPCDSRKCSYPAHVGSRGVREVRRGARLSVR